MSASRLARLRRALAPLLLAAPLLVVAPRSAAAAQPKARPGRYKIGPLYLTPRLELQHAGVDTNVFNTQTNPVPDTAAVLRPTLDGALPIGRRFRVTGSGYLDLNYFRRRRSERSTDFGGEGRAELDVGRATLFGGGGGSQARQRFSIELDERLLRQEKWATAGFGLRLRRKLQAILSGTGRVHTFGDLELRGFNVKETLDRNSLTGNAQLRFALTPLTTFTASVDAIEDRFFNQTGDLPRKVRSFRYLGGFEFGPRALLNGSVLAGVREFPGTSAGAPPYRGPTLSVGAAVPVGSSRLNAIAQRDVFYASTGVRTRDEQLRNTYVSSRYRGELAADLPFDLIGQGFGEYSEARFVLPGFVGGLRVRRVERAYSAGVSLLRRFGDKVRIGGAFTWTRRVSNLPGASYEGLRYGLQAEAAP